MENQVSNTIQFFEEEDHDILSDALNDLFVDMGDGLICEIPTVLQLAYQTIDHFVEKSLQIINDGEQENIVLTYFTNEEVREALGKADIEGDTELYEEMLDHLYELLFISQTFEYTLMHYVNETPLINFEQIFIRELIDFAAKQNRYIPLLPATYLEDSYL